MRAPAAALALLVAAPALAAERPAPPVWPNTPLARVEALALLQSLNAALLSGDSATLTLDGWCTRHHLAPAGTRVTAERVRGAEKPVTAALRADLQVSADEPVRYRRVRLHCGDLVLSEADNWYVPARLTPAMNAALETSDIAFGRAVQMLHFRRQTISAKLLWSPLPADWDERTAPIETPGGATISIPDHVIEHRAMLRLPDGTPFSEVVEDYTGAVLAFPPPVLER